MAATFPGVCAVVPAAGFGRRMQTECPKQYLSIGNKTILEHAVAALLADARVQRVVIAVSPGDRRFSQLPLAQHPQITVVDGGAERADSVLAGLQALPEAQWVLVHDAARPACIRTTSAACCRCAKPAASAGSLRRQCATP